MLLVEAIAIARADTNTARVLTPHNLIRENPTPLAAPRARQLRRACPLHNVLPTLVNPSKSAPFLNVIPTERVACVIL
jgi:hypothetical protein